MSSFKQNTYLNINNIINFDDFNQNPQSINKPNFTDINIIIQVIKDEYMNKLILSNQLKINNLKKIYNSIVTDVLPNFISKFDNDNFENLLRDDTNIANVFLDDFDKSFEFYLSEYKPIIASIRNEIDLSYQVIKEVLKIIIDLDKATKLNDYVGIKKWLHNFTTLITLDYKYNILDDDISLELETIENDDDESAWKYSIIIFNNVNNDFLFGEDIWSLIEIDTKDSEEIDYTDFNKLMNVQFNQVQSCCFFIQDSFIVLDEDKIYFNNIFSEFLKIFMNIQTITNSSEISSKKLSDFKIAISKLNQNTSSNSQIDSCLSTIIEIVCGNKEMNDFSSTLKHKVNYYNFLKNCILLPKMFHLSTKLNIKDPDNITSSFFESLVKIGYSSLVSNQCYQMSLLKKNNSHLCKNTGISKFISDVIFANCCPCCKYLNLVKFKSTNLLDGSYIVRNVTSDLSHIDNKSLVEIIPSLKTKSFMWDKILSYDNLVDLQQYKRFNENMRKLFGFGKAEFHIVLDLNIASNVVLDVPVDYLKNKSESFKRLWSSLNLNRRLLSPSDIHLKLAADKQEATNLLALNDITPTSLDEEILNEISKTLNNVDSLVLINNEFSLKNENIIPLMKRVLKNLLFVSEEIRESEYSKAFLA